MREEEVERLRAIVRDCIGRHEYASATFYAGRVALATADPLDIYMEAQALLLAGHHRRALHLLTSSPPLLRDPRFRCLAAKCLEELKEWHDCLTMLGEAKVDDDGNVISQKDTNMMNLDKQSDDHEINILSAICLLRAKAYQALDNRDIAKQWFKAAVKADPMCYEAMECLVDNYMLTCEEEKRLLSSLNFRKEDQWLYAHYSCMISKHEKSSVLEAKFRDLEEGTSGVSFSNSSSNKSPKYNADLMACKAEYYYQCGEYQKCFDLTSAILEKDAFHLKCVLYYLVASVELNRPNDIYVMADSLVKNYPNKAVSWFAVGCYYYCIKKYSQARQHFSKATSIEGTYAPAWIATCNTYAAQQENDHALTAYRTTARLFPGCHLPMLYIGMESMRTRNFKLAEQYLLEAKKKCPYDPLVYNELGVVAYHMKDYEKAAEWLELALDNLAFPLSELWEPTLVNLAHSLRKLKKYHKAIIYYEKALALSTRSLSAFAGLAYTYHLTDKYDEAITYYHQALWLKPDDQFCTDMLNLAIEDDAQTRKDFL
ncbi:anaphase promoting complex 6 isoform X1 [Carex rostrata]